MPPAAVHPVFPSRAAALPCTYLELCIRRRATRLFSPFRPRKKNFSIFEKNC